MVNSIEELRRIKASITQDIGSEIYECARCGERSITLDSCCGHSMGQRYQCRDCYTTYNKIQNAERCCNPDCELSDEAMLIEHNETRTALISAGQLDWLQ